MMAVNPKYVAANWDRNT